MKALEWISYAALVLAAIVIYPGIRVLIKRGMRW
jgi:hypothetical protein